MPVIQLFNEVNVNKETSPCQTHIRELRYLQHVNQWLTSIISKTIENQWNMATNELTSGC